MGKNKLRKFAEMETFPNVIQCSATQTPDLTTPHTIAGNWHSDFFHNDNPIVLELGCGRGEYTVGLAQMFPDKNFVGIDIKGARIWAGARQACLDNMANVGFLRTNIEFLTRFFALDEVSEIWITFPDPQMKKATKRLTSSYFMERYSTIMKDNGIVNLKTDSPFLYQYTLEMLKANSFPCLTNTPDLYHSDYTDPVLSLKTHYERQWLDRGMTIKYLRFMLPKQDTYIEPDVEIEKDTYRSYGRNYHTQNQSLNL